MRKRTIKHPPIEAYNKDRLANQLKKWGLFKSKYTKQEMLDIYRARIAEAVKKVRHGV